jgi:membrane-bound lytic murein transglycosylase
MQQRRLIVLFCALISSCVYCQIDRSYAGEEIDTKQVDVPKRGIFGKHWRHQIFDAQSKLSKINNETIAAPTNAVETIADAETIVENSGSREGKCRVEYLQHRRRT